jgi:serine/threonine protein kinase/tetratricopeptide (TPR) repeat protein
MAIPILDEAAVFNAARQLQGPEARRLYLDSACGNDKRLLARIEALLRVYDQEETFLESPAVPTRAATAPLVSEGPGTQIGAYKLVEQIGEGGFAVVFLAEQQHPVRRTVALKILKPGMDSRAIVARFEAERQAVALMDHPNIARVFDGGETASGRPYFVMELVKGVPITRYCDEQQLTPRERLGLFMSVCRAVQHAHQKGIIHRDLKPTNVLVAAHDGQLVPKVIDFGVAKALGNRLTETTLVTGFGTIVGTLEYMSPEQAEFDARDIDTRADIYTLGVLLYELLTGTTPLTRERLEQMSASEVLRAIREEEPPKPSARLRNAERGRMKDEKKALGRIGSSFIVHPSSFQELDWIVMKALDKDRNRRYATANSLARDIERYLQDEPVEACPPSAWYRIRKFAGKNRMLLGAASAFAILLTAGIIVSTSLAVRAMHAEQAASDNATLAREALTAEAERRRQTREALEMLTSQVIDEWLGRQQELLPEHRKFLERTVAGYEQLARDTGQEEASRAGVAAALQRVGIIRMKLGQMAEAERAHRRSRDLYEQLAADFPTVPAYRHGLGGAHCELGVILGDTGRAQDAEHAYREALSLQQQLADDFPMVREYRYGLAGTQTNLGKLLRKMGRDEDAEPAYRAALILQQQLADEFPTVLAYRAQLAANYSWLGHLLWDTNRTRAAEDAYREGLKLRQRAAADFPTVPACRHELAGAHSEMGRLLLTAGRTQDAEKAYREALKLQQQLATEFPGMPAYRDQLAMFHDNLGILLLDTGKAQDAEQAHRAAIKLWQQLADDCPTVAAYRSRLASGHDSLGTLFHRTRRTQDAEDAYRAALKLRQQLAADFPDVPDYRNDLAGSMVNLAILLHRSKPGLARQLLEQAEPHHRAALQAKPRDARYRRYFRNNRSWLGQTLVGLGDHAAAADAAAQLIEAAIDQRADVYNAACFLARCLSLAERDTELSEAQRKERAEAYADRAMATLRQAVQNGYKDFSHMKKDSDLDPLRSRADFQKLLAELQATPPSPSK